MLKPGWQTSEFFLSVVSVLGTAAVAILNKLPDQLTSVSAIAGMLAKLVVPLVSGWITTKYIASRTDLKTSAMGAGKAAAIDPLPTLNK